MESKLAREARAALAATIQRLTPEQRLNAFLQHCQLMAALRQAGRLRLRPSSSKSFA
jgi:hypothetical protein